MSKKSDRGTKRPKLSKVEGRQPVGDMEIKPCGCREQRFDDETIDAFPCVPHAFQKAANALLDAANAIGYVGHTLEQAEAQQRAMMEMNEQVEKGIEDGSITKDD